MSVPISAQDSCLDCICGHPLSLLQDVFFSSENGVKFQICAENYRFCPQLNPPLLEKTRATYLRELQEMYNEEYYQTTENQ